MSMAARWLILVPVIATTVARAAMFAGVVVSPTGAPVENAELRLAYGPVVLACTEKSDAQGRFRTTILQGCPGYVWARAEGLAPGFARIGEGTATIQLYSQRVASGSVTRSLTGEPVAGARITLRLLHKKKYFHPAEIAACPFSLSTASDGDGAFVLSGVYPVEEYDLVVSATDCAGEITPLPPDSAQPLRIALHPEGTLEACAVDLRSGRPIAGATIEVERTRWGVGTTTTDASGAFRIGELGHERLNLRAWSDTHFLSGRKSASVLSKAGQHVRASTLLMEPGYRPLLRVHDADTGRPITRGRITLDSLYEFIPREAALDWATQALPLLPRLPAGCVVEASDYVTRSLSLLPPAPQLDVKEIDVAMTPAPILHLVVVDALKAPIPLADVTAVVSLWRGGLRTLYLRHITSASGYVQLRNEEAGSFQFIVEKQGYSPREEYFPSRQRSATLELVLQRTGAVLGRVRTSDGSPIASATVTLLGGFFTASFPGRATVEVQPDGAWRCNAVPATPQGLTLFADAPGMRASYVQSVKVRPGEDVEAPELVLRPLLNVSGRVVEEGTRRPVADCVLRCREQSLGLSPPAVVTGADGAFTLPGLAPGLVFANLEPPEPEDGAAYVPPFLQWWLSDHDVRDCEIELSRGVPVSGRVLDADTGGPVEGATVKAARITGGESVSGEVGGLASDPRGQFRMAVPWLWSQARVSADKPGYLAAHTDVLLSGDALEGVEVRFTRGGSVSGMVVDASGEGVVDARILARRSEATQGSSRETLSGTARGLGKFQISSMRPGAWELVAARRNQKPSFSDETPAKARATLQVAAGEECADVVLTLPSEETYSGVLAGVVLDHEGQACPRADISFRCVRARDPALAGNRGGSISADMNGKFRAENLPDGIYLLSVQTVSPLDGSRLNAREFTGIQVPCDDLVLHMPMPARVKGRVVDAGTGEPVGAFYIAVTDAGLRAVTAMSTVANIEGRFDVVVDSTGTFVARVTSTDRRFGSSEPFTVAEGQTVEGLVVKVSAGAVLTVAVKDSQGRPAPQVAVTARPSEDPAYLSSYEPFGRLTDAQGTIVFRTLAAGRYNVSAQLRRRRQATQVDVKTGEPASLEMVLAAGGTVEGSVHDRAGGPVVGAMVSCAGAFTRSDDAGRFRLEEIDAGSQHVIAEWPRLRETPPLQRVQDVEVKEGETTRVEFAEPSGRIFGRVTQAGRPVEGAMVQAEGDGAGGRSETRTAADRQGRYELEGLPAGPVAMQVTVPLAGSAGWVPARARRVQLGDGESQQVDFELPGGAIGGLVTVPNGYAPQEAGIFVLSQENGIDIRVWPDGDGRFLIAPLDAGTYILHVSIKGLIAADRTVKLGEGEEKTDLRLELKTGGRIVGSVRSTRNAQNCQVEVRLARGGRLSAAVQDDRYEVSAVPAGSHQVCLIAEGVVREAKPVELEEGKEARVDFDLRKPVTLRLTLRGVETSALEGRGVPFYGQVYFQGRHQPVGWRTTGQTGVYEVSLGCLAYDFTIGMAGYQPARFRLDLSGQAPGAVVEQAVELVRTAEE